VLNAGDIVRVSEIVNPKTPIANDMKGQVGEVERRHGKMLYVKFVNQYRDYPPSRVLFFEKELIKLNPSFVVTKIKDILLDQKRILTTKLFAIKTVDGGCMKHIIENTDLSLSQKLVAIAAEIYNPVTIKQLHKIFVSQKGEVFVKNAIERLEKLKVVYTKKNKVYPVVTLLPPPKTESEKEEKIEITESDKDVLLFMQKLQEFYVGKSVEASISKNGKKNIRRAVEWLNATLIREFNSSFSKESAYASYIEYALGHLAGTQLKHLKRLNYAGILAGWVSRTQGSFRIILDKFEPILLNHDKTDKAQFLGINRGAIPKAKDIVKSGYYTTAIIFFVSRASYERYPICTEVLYALEMLIAFKIFNRVNVDNLLDLHKLYVRQYDKAKKMGKLDNLLEYSKTGKVKSFYCADCDKFDYCTDQGKSVKTCKDKLPITNLHT
jgi:hypothetical protein